MIRTIALLCTVAILAQGCMVGPRYRDPAYFRSYQYNQMQQNNHPITRPVAPLHRTIILL